MGRAKKTKSEVEGGSKTKLTVRVRNGIHQIPELEGVIMTETWSETEKIPVKAAKPAPAPKKPAAKEEKAKKGEAKDAKDAKAEAPPADGAEEPKPEEAKPEEAKPEEVKPEEAKAPAEGEPAQEQPKEPEQPAVEQQYEEKVRQRSREYNVPFTTVSHAIPPDQRKHYAAVEAELWAADREILDVKAAKNDLEAYAYEMKGNLEPYGSYEHYIAAAVKDAYVAELQATIDFIYSSEEADLKSY